MTFYGELRRAVFDFDRYGIGSVMRRAERTRSELLGRGFLSAVSGNFENVSIGIVMRKQVVSRAVCALPESNAGNFPHVSGSRIHRYRIGHHEIQFCGRQILSAERRRKRDLFIVSADAVGSGITAVFNVEISEFTLCRLGVDKA